MTDSHVIKARSLAFFLLGLLLLNPPLLHVFGVGATLAGVPLLYAWLFGVWALLIAAVGYTASQQPAERSGEGTDA